MVRATVACEWCCGLVCESVSLACPARVIKYLGRAKDRANGRGTSDGHSGAIRLYTLRDARVSCARVQVLQGQGAGPTPYFTIIWQAARAERGQSQRRLSCPPKSVAVAAGHTPSRSMSLLRETVYPQHHVIHSTRVRVYPPSPVEPSCKHASTERAAPLSSHAAPAFSCALRQPSTTRRRSARRLSSICAESSSRVICPDAAGRSMAAGRARSSDGCDTDGCSDGGSDRDDAMRFGCTLGYMLAGQGGMCKGGDGAVGGGSGSAWCRRRTDCRAGSEGECHGRMWCMAAGGGLGGCST
jgi:hypothetical protein